MKRSKNIVEERRNKVLELLKVNESMNAQDLAEMLGVSPLTIRRDFQYLEDHKKVERFYGGAAVVDSPLPDEAAMDTVSLYRERIAQYAAGLVEDGDTIFINTSSTALQMIKYIKNKRVTVITNNGKAIYTEHSPEVSIILSGGELREIKGAMVGEFALNNISKVTAKKSFVGCVGLSAENGMTTEMHSEVHINQLMLRRVTKMAYILADHTKIGKNSSFVSCPPEEIVHVITDELAPEHELKKLRSMNIGLTQVRLR